MLGFLRVELEVLRLQNPLFLLLGPLFLLLDRLLLARVPARTALGLKGGHRDCRMCDTAEKDALAGTGLEDRMGHRFPLLRQRLPEGCLVRLMNMLPTDAADRREIRFRCMELTDETPVEAEQVLAAFGEYRKTGLRSTAGHWNRAVL